VVGAIDDDGGVGRALLDQPEFPIADAAVISLPWSRDAGGERATSAELAACDVVVVRSTTAAAELESIRAHLRSPQDLRVLDTESIRERCAELAYEIATLASTRRRVDLALERDGTDASLLHVLQPDPERAVHSRFVVASEPWSWYPGWRIDGCPSAPALRVVEGISSAFLLPQGEIVSPLVARYDPPSARLGCALAAAGLLLALGLILAPQRGA
jgi:hypothetical protein